MSDYPEPDPLPPPLPVFNSINWPFEVVVGGGGAGTQGMDGVQGFQGFQGFQGYQGIDIAGTQGYQGIGGIQGAQGSFGFQGFQGLQGIAGLQGSQGNQGAYANSVGCVLYKASQSVGATSSFTTITFGSGTTVYDPLNFHSEVTNNERITPSIAGWYYVSAAAIQVNNVATAYKNVNIRRSQVGATVLYTYAASTGVSTLAQGGGGGYLLEFNGTTDYVSMEVRHTAGGTLDWEELWFSLFLVIPV